jgi:hypothetical protein
MKRARRLLAVPLILAGFGSAALAVETLQTHMTPPGQPPIEAITANDLAPIQSWFNRDADRARVLILVSPT